MQEVQASLIVIEAIKRIKRKDEEATPERILEEINKAHFFISENKFFLLFEEEQK